MMVAQHSNQHFLSSDNTSVKSKHIIAFVYVYMYLLSTRNPLRCSRVRAIFHFFPLFYEIIHFRFQEKNTNRIPVQVRIFFFESKIVISQAHIKILYLLINLI